MRPEASLYFAKNSYSAFLSLPHEYTDLRKAIERRLADLEHFEVECKYVVESEGRKLRDEVTEKLGECDFIIGDVSTGSPKLKGPRPNIMWELGYAWHMGLPRVILVQKMDKDQVASLIIDQHYIEYDRTEQEDLLGRLMTTVDGVCSRIETERTKKRAESVYSASVFVDRVEINIPQRIREAKQSIRILETNLESVASGLADHMATALKDKNRSRFTVQICTLNPYSQFASARAKQLARLKKDYETELIESLHETYQKLSDCDRDRWELKIYDTFPTQITFAFDENVFSSVMALGKRSRQMLHFQVKSSNKGAYDTFVAHFNQLYGSAETYVDWLKRHEDRIAETNNKRNRGKAKAKRKGG